MTRPKARPSPSDAPDRVTARSKARYSNAAVTLAPITLDAEHAAALALILERDGVTRAAAVRAAIIRHAARNTE